MFPVFASLAFGEWGWGALSNAIRHPVFAAVVLLVVGGLMVSTVPTWSFKNFKVPSQAVLPLLLGIGGFVVVLVTEPWAALAGAGLIYVGMILLSVRSYARLKREAEQMRVAPEPAGSDAH